jgi:HlyD family secretion protein
MAKLPKTAWLFLLLAGVAVLVFVAASGAGRDRPVAIAITHAARQDLSSWTTANGKIEPLEPHVIQSQLTTLIEKVLVKEGQTVHLGESLFVLDAVDTRAELSHEREQLFTAQEERRLAQQGGAPDEIAQLDSDLNKTVAEIQRLRREGDSLQRLYAQQAATRHEVDQNKAALDRAEADKRLIEQKKAALLARSKTQADRAAMRSEQASDSIRSLERKVNSAQVTAPSEGTIYSLPVKAATFVHVGDVLAELADLRHVRVRAFVDEPELGSLKEGQAVEVTWDALPNRTWTGVVQQLPKTIVTRGSRNVGEVLCSVTNENSELLPNTNVNVRIRTAMRQNVLAIPRGAVHSEDGKRFVFIIDDGHLQKREVAVGISDPNIYEVKTGLTESDSIALERNTELHEGMAVVPTDK